MKLHGIKIKKLPKLKKPILIAGFGGWGNAMGVSTGMVDYLINSLNGSEIASMNPDYFYRYDEARPNVSISNGSLKDFSPPLSMFHSCETDEDLNDLVVFKGHEPNLAWYLFVEEVFSLCNQLGIKKIITLGSMFDRVIHTDIIISGMYSTGNLYTMLSRHNVYPISYQGPSAIHSIIQAEGPKNGFECASLWCHCPYYLQSGQHFGFISSLGTLLSSIGHFNLDVAELDQNWEVLKQKIDHLISTNDELKAIVEKLKEKGSSQKKPNIKPMIKKGDKVIDLKDFLPTKPERSED